MTSDRDICENRHGGDLFSLAAHDRIAATLPDARRRALDWIRSRGSFGATAQEYADHLHVGVNTISGRFSELKKAGLVVQSRKQASRNGGRVVVAAEYGGVS